MRERHVGDRLDELDRLAQDRGLVGERNPGVDVEHLRTGLDLGDRVGDHRLEVAALHLLGQLLAAGRVDALADDHERPVEADHDLLRRPTSARSPSRGLLFSARADEPLEPLVGVVPLEPGGSGGHLGLEVVAARPGLAAPLLEVRVGADQARAHRGGVDRLLEALGELARAAPAVPCRR